MVTNKAFHFTKTYAWVLLPWTLILFLVRGLFDPHLAFIARDIDSFHLPLRAAFRELWFQSGAFPEWNPLLHGGQPILSNPNYAAFYPPSWLALLFEPVTGLQLLYILHLFWLALGTFLWLRDLEARPSVAVLGAMSCSAGFALYLVSSINLLCGLAWLPWICWFALRTLDTRGRARLRSIVFASFGITLQLLAGEPVACLLSGFFIGALWILKPREGFVLGLIPILAVCFGAVQLLPTMERLRDVPLRIEMTSEEALSFSTPPERLGEFLWPHLWGEANRNEEGLFFGWGLQSHDFPYVLSFYPGWILLLTALGLGFRKSTPHGRLWLLMGALGLFVALGRYNPLLVALIEYLPGLGAIRYPEKFILLTCFSITMAGALGLEEYFRRPPKGALLLLAGLGALATLAPLGLWVSQAPSFAGIHSFVKGHSGIPPTEDLVHAGVSYLSGELLMAAGLGLLGTLLLFFAGRKTVSRRTLEGAAILLLGLDLAAYGGSAFLTWPVEEYRRPPAILASLASGDRVVPPPGETGGGTGLRLGEPGLISYRDQRGEAFPYTGLLWGYAYLFHPDYDFMATGWAIHTQRLPDALGPEGRLRLYGLWNAQGTIEKVPSATKLALWLMTAHPPPVATYRALEVTAPRFRSPRRVEEFATLEGAVLALSRDQSSLGSEEFLWSPQSRARREVSPREILRVEERGDEIEILSGGRKGGWIVAAITFHSHWEATIDGEPTPIYPTASGQMAMKVPAGEHRLQMRYRDPWVRVGAWITGLSLVVVAFGAFGRGNRETGSGEQKV